MSLADLAAPWHPWVTWTKLATMVSVMAQRAGAECMCVLGERWLDRNLVGGFCQLNYPGIRIRIDRWAKNRILRF